MILSFSPHSTRLYLLLALAALPGACTTDRPDAPPDPPTTTAQSIESTALFIGISIVDEATAWISGTGGQYARTTDGGRQWRAGRVPGADSLQFRDVHAFNAQSALLMSIGNGDQSRIYKTTDAGATWDRVFTNEDPEGFFDCMDFWDDSTGLAFSDSFDGAFYLIKTTDGGASWGRIPPDVLPAPLPGEGSFAASGTCLITQGAETAYVGTGAGGKARVLKTPDRGASWSVVDTPVTHGTATSGIASLSFLNDLTGVVAGGEIARPDSIAQPIAFTRDGGVTWLAGAPPPFTGAIYGITYVPGPSTATLVAAGPRGIAYSRDHGTSWTLLSEDEYWSVAFSDRGSGWATGPDGNILHIVF